MPRSRQRVFACMGVGLALGFFAPAVAHAADANPGSASTDDLEPLPAPTDSSVSRTQPPNGESAGQRGPSDYAALPAPVPPPYVYIPRDPPHTYKWGLNLYLGGLILEEVRHFDASMGVLGLGVRFRPVRGFAIEASGELGGGYDTRDLRRRETSASLSALVYLNPRDMAQIYLTAGAAWSRARITDVRYGVFEPVGEDMYHHVGGIFGGGVEFRVAKAIAINTDLRGFYRGAVDSDVTLNPGLTGVRGVTTDRSTGAILRGGLTFYW